MTVTQLDKIATRPVPTAAQIGQATAVEQARAVAEVQAAVYVAQANPRNIEQVTAEMREACGRLALARHAFYSVPNRGNGPSVHLARELVRIWGNSDYGVRELRRDDAAGESEVLAFAWDQQANTRSSRSFINPHARMVKKERQALTDLGDIYLSNQNIGARAVRECIFTVLPKWFTEEAQDICRATLEKGDGKPLADRIRDTVATFDKLGVSADRLERKVGRKRGQWTATDLADFGVAWTSITRDGISADDLFPQQQVTADEITARRKPAETGESITDAQMRKLQAAAGAVGLDRPSRLAYIGDVIGRVVESSKELTKAEAGRVIDALEADAAGGE